MGKIVPRALLEEIRARCDIADTIGAYVPLKRSGGALKACCPFHKEKTPSFTVNPNRQMFHCFGCGASGDVFGFISQYEGVDFVTAVRMLADRTGIRLDLEEDRSDGPRIDKDMLLRIHDEVTRFFQKCLAGEAGAPTRAYLKERDFSDELITSWRLGYAPARREDLLSWGRKRKYSQEQLEQAGLISHGDNGEPYARFRDRLMFPIEDSLGRVIGFSGRIMDKNASPAKYLNTPETPIFHKSRVLFAFNRARQKILDEKCAILCEGQIDTIRCHQYGFTSAVAAQGTALTEDHVRMLKRMTDHVLLLLDPDEAGRKAALRSAELFLAQEMSVQVGVLPNGMDPDLLLQKKGAAGMKQVLDEAQSIVRFQIDGFARTNDVQSEVGLMRTVDGLAATLTHAASTIQRDTLVREAARCLNLPEHKMQDILRKKTFTRYRHEQAGPPQDSAATQAVNPDEEATVGLYMQHVELIAPYIHFLDPNLLTHRSLRLVAKAMREHGADGLEQLQRACSETDTETVSTMARMSVSCSSFDFKDFTQEEALQQALMKLWRKHLENVRKDIYAKRTTASEEEQAQLNVESAHLTHDISLLRQNWKSAQLVMEAHCGPILKK